jgi:hypothetical protein
MEGHEMRHRVDFDIDVGLLRYGDKVDSGIPVSLNAKCRAIPMKSITEDVSSPSHELKVESIR